MKFQNVNTISYYYLFFFLYSLYIKGKEKKKLSISEGGSQIEIRNKKIYRKKCVGKTFFTLFGKTDYKFLFFRFLK